MFIRALIAGLACLLLLAACGPTDKAPDSGELDTPPQDSAAPDSADSATAWAGDTSIEEVPGSGFAPKDCDEIYDQDILPAFEVEISEDDWTLLAREYATGRKRYHPAVFRYGDEQVDNASIRLKGNPDFSWLGDKMQFVIAFNQEDADGRFHGLRKLSLDAPWYDSSMLRDRIGWSVLRGSGVVPAACANTATLTINGEYYGLYTNIEFLDHEWLERVYRSEDTGTLWKYGTDAVANEDARTDALREMERANTVEELDAVGDLDEWVLAFAAEIVLGDNDGYWCCGHNFYLYEHPSQGVQFVPWDLDLGYDFMPYDADPVVGYDSPYDGLFAQTAFVLVANDATWGPKLVDAVETMNAAMDPDTVLAQLDTWEAEFADALYADPHRTIGWEEHQGAFERLRAWIPARHAFLESWVACARGAETDADGDGYPVCEDPDDGDASISPAGVETCDGRDEDANGQIDDLAACDDCVRRDLGASHFLFCSWPRSWEDASEHCAAEGGELSAPEDSAETYLFYLSTWPADQNWWTGAEDDRGRCVDWDPLAWTSGTSDCEDELPSACRVP